MRFPSYSRCVKTNQTNQPPHKTNKMDFFYFVFLGSGVLDTLLMGLVLGDGDCLLWGEADAPRRGGGGAGLAEVWEALGRGEGECRLFCGGERVSRLDLLGGDPFLCLEDTEGERFLAAGELRFGGGEWETLRFDCGEGDALRLGGGGGEAVRLLGGGEGEYRRWIGGEYLRGEGERLRGGGDGDLQRKQTFRCHISMWISYKCLAIYPKRTPLEIL